MSAPNTYRGRGSQLQMSSDGVNFTALKQLTQFDPAGSKQTFVDQTNILTAVNQSQPLAVRVDQGEISCQGKLDPQDTATLLLGAAHAALSLLWFRVFLTDTPNTRYSFQAYVSEWKPFGARVGGVLEYTFKLRLSGSGLQAPS